MSKIENPVKLEAARARMANARASRKKMDYPADVEDRLDDFRALVLAQFIDAGLSAFKDGRKVGGPSDRYFYNKLVRGSLNIKDMILLNDYLPIDWTLILKTMRHPRMFCGLSMPSLRLLMSCSLIRVMILLLTSSQMWMGHDGTESA